MAALRLSPVVFRHAATATAFSSSGCARAAVPFSCSSRSLVSATRRVRSLKLGSPRRRIRRGGATMMDTAASSYANALADLAKSNGTLEATVADIDKVDRVFSDPTVLSFFANPTVEAAKKEKLVLDIATTSQLQPHTANFLNILVDMNRIDIIKDIVKEFEACYNKITGTQVAIVSSVVPLESEDLAQIAKTVQRLTAAKNVRIKTVINPSLVAGFTIRYGQSGSKFIDMSVKKQLDEIASQLEFSSISLA